MFVFKAAVVGAGVMGGEIAQVVAAAGFPVVLKDTAQEPLDKGLAHARTVTEKSLGSLVKKGRLDADAAAAQGEEILARITPALDHAAFGDVDLVIEAVPERLEVKQAVFAELDAVTPGHAILASNTSGLSITEIGEATSRPQQVVGLHFFWPASRMRLVEVVESDDTSPETVQAAVNFAQALRKTPIRCAECPGFVVNRILAATASEVWRHHEQTGADPEAIDALIVEHAGMPMGPFRVADMSGLDTTLKVAQDMHAAYGERFFVPQALRDKVEAGELGAKSGKGFYEHR
jgi:3-hydroxyacyl-CoA dehydrogenase